jgi:hypothetical protein
VRAEALSFSVWLEGEVVAQARRSLMALRAMRPSSVARP